MKKKHFTLDPPQRSRGGVQTQCEEGPIRPNGGGDFGPRLYGRGGGAIQPISGANAWERPLPRDGRANEIGGCRPASCRSRHQPGSSRASSNMEPPPHVACPPGDSSALTVVSTRRAPAVVRTLRRPACARPRSRAPHRRSGPLHRRRATVPGSALCVEGLPLFDLPSPIVAARCCHGAVVAGIVDQTAAAVAPRLLLETTVGAG